jgi:hypothetical protein
VILPPHFAKLAARGRATLALIPVREPRDVKRTGPRGTARTGRSATYTTRPWAPETGRHEPLRPTPLRRREDDKTKHEPVAALCDIRIISHHTMLLAELTDETPGMLELVRAAGEKTRAGFAHEWMRHYDQRHGWPPLTEALCPRCDGHAIIKDGAECPDCDTGVILVEERPDDTTILAMFKRRHGHRLVHVVRFEIDQTIQPRFLSPSSRPRGDEHGYTGTPAMALTDAGEAVPAAFQDSLSRDASERDARARQRRVDQAIASGDLGALEGEMTRSARALGRSAGRAAKHRDAA